MTQRVLRIKFFLGSTTEKVEAEVEAWLEENNICPGNFIEQKLYKLGNVYQFVLVYASLKDTDE